MFFGRSLAFVVTALASASALGGVAPLPEPDSFALLAIAGVAAIVVALRNRRK